jgi:hypothetical protein
MLQPLLDFKNSDIKFNLYTFMNTLKDRNHEGWVLAVYPDPQTSKPLIGAGFSLEVMATEHIQRDPLNPHPFIEPSSAQLWQAAGLAPDQLESVLARFNRNLSTWGQKNYRRKAKMHTLPPDLTEEEATRLLRISAIQAIENAKAYCRRFDQLTAPQQMALSQLVYQMGVNLEEFVQFLSALNDDSSPMGLPHSDSSIDEATRWKTVQHTLVESQWARHYALRAVSVIAMFDPGYVENPTAAERQIEAAIRPSVKHRRRRASTGSLRARNTTDHNKGHNSKQKRNLT